LHLHFGEGVCFLNNTTSGEINDLGEFQCSANEQVDKRGLITFCVDDLVAFIAMLNKEVAKPDQRVFCPVSEHGLLS
jgi:hypothetical protein